MSRHRNVRSMNYSDEYDGYDDVYGHSVEDEYCISPSDEAQFIYDRTRQPQISAFFSEQDNITEEDENLQQTNDRKISDSFVQPKLSDLDEAKLRSCLEEMRNVIGDCIPERVLVETVLKCDFNINKSLDTILSNATSSNENTSEDPKPQRVRKERDRDFINFQSSLHCLVSNRDKHLSENIDSSELRDAGHNTCQEVSFYVKRDEITKTHDNAASCSIIPDLCEKRNQFSSITHRNLTLDCSSSTSYNIPSSLPRCNVEKENINQVDESKLKVQIEDSVQVDSLNSSVGVDSCTRFSKLKSESNLDEMTEQKSLTFNVDEETKPHKMQVNLLSSMDEESEPSPSILLPKQLSCAVDRGQALQKSNLWPKSPSEEEQETKDHCQAFRNLTIQESGLPSVDFCKRNKGALDVLRASEEDRQADSGSSHETDNSDDERGLFSPLAALASRHDKHRSAESCSADEKKVQLISRWKHEDSGTDRKVLNKMFGPTVCVAEFSSRGKEKSITECGSQGNSTLVDKSSDDEENTLSPLAALADKINRGKGDGSSWSDLSSSSSAASGLDQRCTQKPAGSSIAYLMRGTEEAAGTATKILCRCKSESDGYPSSSPLFGSTSINDSIRGCKGQHVPQSVFHQSDTGPVCDGPSFPSAISNDRERESQKEFASSLSDLAFFHLTRSASCGMKSDHDLTNKRIHSDTVISKSVPGGFVIPFLKQDGCVQATWKDNSKDEQEEEVKMEIERNTESSEEEWVIDLSNAIRDPGLRLADNVALPANKLPSQIIAVRSIEEKQENNTVAPCMLDASGLLKIKLSCTKRRCSPCGKALCRRWRELVRPYVPPTKQYTGSIVHFTFDIDSPDDKVIACRGYQNKKNTS